MYIHIIDRSDLDEVIAQGPNGKVSRREMLVREGVCPRCDIVLVNATRSGHEYVLYVTATGFSGSLAILDFLSDDQHAEVMRIADKMRRNAVTFPPAAKLLANR